MDEDTVKQVMLKYLELKGKQPRRRARQSSGPDILVEGTAIEVKGSKIEERSFLNQLAIYLHDYGLVEIALPCDALSLPFLYKLRALEQLSRKDGLERTIRVYLVAAVATNRFAVLDVSSVGLVSIKIDQILYALAKKSTKDEPSKKAALALQIEGEIRKGLENVVRGEGRPISVRGAFKVDRPGNA